MAKARRNLGGTMVQLQLPLSSLPTAGMAAGSLRRLEAVHEALDAAITASGLTRAYIAEEISRLTGGSVSENHINNWTAESKMGERHIPLEYVAALTVILGDVRILAAACCPTAGRLIMAVSRGTSTRGWAAPDRPRPAGWCATASIFAWAALDDVREAILWLRRQFLPTTSEADYLTNYAASRSIVRHPSETDAQCKTRVVRARSS